MLAMLDVDTYLGRRFDLTRQNCWHLVRDAWLDLTGVDLGDRTPERVTTGTLVDRFNTDVPAFTKQPGPVDPSIVLMTSPGAVPHVGVFVRGRVLQMTPLGVSFMPPHVATAGFESVGYYR